MSRIHGSGTIFGYYSFGELLTSVSSILAILTKQYYHAEKNKRIFSGGL